MTKNNKVTLQGNLAGEAKILKTFKGDDFAAMTIATNNFYLKDGKWHNGITVWHDVYAFKPSLIALCKRLEKGERIAIEGTLHYKPLEIDGKKVKEAKIILLNIKDAPLKKAEETTKNTAVIATADEFLQEVSSEEVMPEGVLSDEIETPKA